MHIKFIYLDMHKILFALALSASAANIAQAALLDRGGGLIYDDVLDITWLQDANYSGALMTWSQAMAWAENLEYYDQVRGTRYNDWRLPAFRGDPDSACAFTGTDCGYNVNPLSSEMAHLFYVSLGNIAWVTETGVRREGTATIDWGLVNTGPFENLMSHGYWTSTEASSSAAWNFMTIVGLQDTSLKGYPWYAMAVRDGDVLVDTSTQVVTEPPLLGLLGLGLVGLGLARKSRRQKLSVAQTTVSDTNPQLPG